MPIDFKKQEKEIYTTKTTPSIIFIPEMKFLTIKGKGNPNNNTEYITAVQTLYGISYAIKMNNKHILEYVVPPLEGFWEVDDPNFEGGGKPITDKNKFLWTMMIRQPEFVTLKTFNEAKELLSKKKPNLDTSKVNLITFTEGLITQALHIGSYDDEARTVKLIDTYAIENGYELDFNGNRHHHEIYISDPRKTKPEKLKTIIRHPVKNKIT